MSDEPVSGVRDALDELVHQFADPLSCLRELIQNSIDAGTSEVEVAFEYEAGEDDADGAMVIRVQDWGGGMDREIIDNKLTRLFSSGKDGDRTKIGKFGIGFVSVFALQPDAVCVDTGRAGERWRILFDRDCRFTRARLDEPIEGTTVRIIKTATPGEFEQLRARARSTVRHWCRHAEVDIFFDGDRLNEAFELEDDALQVREDLKGRILVVGHRGRTQHYHGFYNRGLTLHEGPATVPRLEGLSVKVMAGDLEHTLTRDAVIENEAYHDVVGDVWSLAHSTLFDATFERLESALRDGVEGPPLERLYDGAVWHLEHVERSRVRPSKAARARAVFRTVEGAPLTLDAVMDLGRRDEVLVARARSHLTDALSKGGSVIVRAPNSGPLRQAIAAAAADAELVEVVDRWVLPRPARDDAERARWDALAARTRDLFEAVGTKVGRVAFAHLKYPGSPVGKRVAVSMVDVETPVPIGEVDRLPRGVLSLFASARALVVNADHAAVEAIVALSGREPELAAYKLVKMFWLESGELDMERDSDRAEAAWELRCRRVGS